MGISIVPYKYYDNIHTKGMLLVSLFSSILLAQTVLFTAFLLVSDGRGGTTASAHTVTYVTLCPSWVLGGGTAGIVGFTLAYTKH